MPQRARRVGVAEGLEPCPRRLLGQPGRLAGQPGHGLEQRPVEQLLVQPPGLARVPAPLREEVVGRVPVPRLGALHRPQRPADLAQHGRVLGQHVRAPELAQLEQVLDAAQEPVGVGQAGRVRAAHVTAAGQRGEGVQGGGGAERLVGTAVHELQQLHGELDVPQPPGAELDLAPGPVGGQAAQHPAPHRLHVGHEVLALCGLPDHRPDGGQVGAAELRVARDRPGLEQRLELPGLRPALVIGAMAGQGTDQRPVAALRAEVRIHREQGLLGRGGRADPDHPGREPGRGAQGGRLPAVSRLARSGSRTRLLRTGLSHEDHIDVAGVVQLAAAALPHRDHREPGRRGARRQLGSRDRERCLERGRGEVRQFGRDLGQALGPGEVPAGQLQQPAPVADAQRGRRVGAAQPRRIGHRLAIAGHRADRGQQLVPHLVRRRAAQRFRAAQHPPVGGMAREMTAERGTGPQHPDQAGPEVRVRAQDRPQPGVGRQPGQAGQGEVRVGCGRERLEQAGVGGGRVQAEILGEQALRARRIGESQRGQLASQGRPAQPARPTRPAGHPRTILPGRLGRSRLSSTAWTSKTSGRPGKR